MAIGHGSFLRSLTVDYHYLFSLFLELILSRPGHAGHEIADYAVEAIAPSIKHALVKETLDKVVYDAELVSKMLVDAIASVDDALADALYALFPNQDVLEKLSDKEIREIINDSDRGGVNHRTVIRCMRGSTILISLLDAEKRGLWVASLGDCHAGMTHLVYNHVTI